MSGSAAGSAVYRRPLAAAARWRYTSSDSRRLRHRMAPLLPLPSATLAVVVDLAAVVIGALAQRGDVQGVVEPPVPGTGEPVAGDLPAAGLGGGAAGVGRVVIGREPPDVPDLPQDQRGHDHTDALDVGQARPRPRPRHDLAELGVHGVIWVSARVTSVTSSTASARRGRPADVPGADRGEHGRSGRGGEVTDRAVRWNQEDGRRPWRRMRRRHSQPPLRRAPRRPAHGRTPTLRSAHRACPAPPGATRPPSATPRRPAGSSPPSGPGRPRGPGAAAATRRCCRAEAAGAPVVVVGGAPGAAVTAADHGDRRSIGPLLAVVG